VNDLSGWPSSSNVGWHRDGGHRRAGRERARRRAIRRRRHAALLTLVAVAAAAALAISLAGGGGGSSAARPSLGAVRPRPAASLSSSVASRPDRGSPVVPVTKTVRSPGSLPQTHAYPSGTSAHFKSLMASLWTGIVHDSAAPAMAAFFPKGAYVQLKAIEGAGSDWTNRLVHDYSLDIAAAHALLGRDAAHASLIAVNVPAHYGHWIEPGVCYNSIGYYEMPNARVVYRLNGQTRSFGIASMISWRGVWYVVHLGAILRSGDSGEVDEPASGPGTSVYSGTC
jgi:hypothetical protein